MLLHEVVQQFRPVPVHLDAAARNLAVVEAPAVERVPVTLLVRGGVDEVVPLYVVPEVGAVGMEDRQNFIRKIYFMRFVITSSPVEEHAVADGALVSAVARDPGLEAHLVLLQVDRDGVHLFIRPDHAVICGFTKLWFVICCEKFSWSN